MVRETPTKQLDCSFIKRVPLPIPTQKGLPIQARVLSAKPGQTETVYNPRTPSRAEVRQENYKRRLMQWTSQGFRALNYKPYQGIGDPFYLDQKKLILHALGQWDESQRDKEDSPAHSEEEDIGSGQTAKPITPAKFVLRRTNKEINTLPKELSRGRNMVRNIRLGHNLFEKLQKDHEEKLTRETREQQAKLERRRTQWQPPSYDSSSEDEEYLDEDLREEVDLRMPAILKPQVYMRGEEDRLSPQPTEGDRTEGTHSRIVFSNLDSEAENKTSRVKSAPGSSKSRKKSAKFSRPYTPQHININSRFSDHRPKSAGSSDFIEAEPLFKQLCCLNWLLEAMEVNPPVAMGPIMECWNLNNIGGRKTTLKKLQKEKERIDEGEKFLSKDVPPKIKGRKSQKPTRHSPQRRYSRSKAVGFSRGTSLADEVMSVVGDNDDSSTGGGGTRPSSAMRHWQTAFASVVEESSPSSLNVKELSSGISVIEEHEDEVDSGADKASENASDKLPKFSQFESYFKDVKVDAAKLDKNLKKELQRAKVTKQLDTLIHEEELQDKRELLERRTGEFKNSVKKLRADLHLIRSKRPLLSLVTEKQVSVSSCAGVIEFQNTANSNAKANLAANLRQMFSEIKEENALLLHDKLEINDRQKLRRCKQKFSAMITEGFSFHRAVDKMRSVIEEERRRLEMMQKKSTEEYEEWLTDIEDNVPAGLQELWYFNEIIRKLRWFGQIRDEHKVESAKQSSTIKFLTVLGKLRPWEICSPHVSAAVEFCRDRIIEMPITDYEEWFQHAFPQIQRPKTAPPSVGGRRN